MIRLASGFDIGQSNPSIPGRHEHLNLEMRQSAQSSRKLAAIQTYGAALKMTPQHFIRQAELEKAV